MNKDIFQKQINWNPVIKNENSLLYDNVVVGGIGGSAIPARILFFLDPIFPIWLHNDFGTPDKTSGDTLFVAISYSGNTKETLSFAEKALSSGKKLAVISSGGKLIELAEQNNLPFILVPEGLMPRDSSTYMLKALVYLLHREDLLEQIEKISLDRFGQTGNIADGIKGTIPLIYSSRKNGVLGYIWKIMLNETAKTPAFSNVFPELTHNEIQSFDSDTNGGLTQNISILMLLDEEDGEDLKKSMNAFMETVEEKGVKVLSLNLPNGKMEKLFETIVSAREVSQKLAEMKGIDPEAIPMIENFKRKLV